MSIPPLEREYSEAKKDALPILRCHYTTLGVNPKATKDEISKAYKEQARKWHPDKNLDNQAEATAKMREINRAYRVLSDFKPGYRAWYDSHREQLLAKESRWSPLYEHGLLAMESCRRDYDEAISSFTEALTLAVSNENARAKIRASLTLAKFKRAHADDLEGNNSWDSDLGKASQLEQPPVHALLVRAKIKNLQEQFEAAEECCFEGLKHCCGNTCGLYEERICDFETELQTALDGLGMTLTKPEVQKFWKDMFQAKRHEQEVNQRRIENRRKLFVYIALILFNVLLMAMLYWVVSSAIASFKSGYGFNTRRKEIEPSSKHQNKVVKEIEVDFEKYKYIFDYSIAPYTKVILFYSSKKDNSYGKTTVLQQYNVSAHNIQSAVKTFAIDCYLHDCEIKKLVREFNLQKKAKSNPTVQIPSLIAIEPGNKNAHELKDGDLSSTSIEKWATSFIKHYVLTVTADNCEEAGGIFSQPVAEYSALLFHKSHIAPITWRGVSMTFLASNEISADINVVQLSIAFRNKMLLGQVRDSEKRLISRFKVTKFPTVLVVKPAAEPNEWVTVSFSLESKSSDQGQDERNSTSVLLAEGFHELNAFLVHFVKQNQNAKRYRKEYEKFMESV